MQSDASLSGPHVSYSGQNASHLTRELSEPRIFPVVQSQHPFYFGPWDTSPQREAFICKDSIDGYSATGYAAG